MTELAASEAQEGRPPLFAAEGAGEAFYPSPGAIILHKKGRTPDGEVMVYLVVGEFEETEPPNRRMIAYKALYPTATGYGRFSYKQHVRPLDMFTTDRFAVLTHAKNARDAWGE